MENKVRVIGHLCEDCAHFSTRSLRCMLNLGGVPCKLNTCKRYVDRDPAYAEFREQYPDVYEIKGTDEIFEEGEDA